MKYKPEVYLNSGFYGDMDDDVTGKSEKIVKCRKPHQCMGGCEKEIQAGEYALLEKGFMDGEPVSSYTCLTCIEDWLEESGQVGFEEDEDMQYETGRG